jgi:hypothetical protein
MDEEEIYNILGCEYLEEELGYPIHFFQVLETSEGKISVNMKRQLNQIFEKVNVADIFEDKDIILEGLKLSSIPIDDLNNQGAAITLIKSKDTNFFLNLFFSKFKDINLSKTIPEIETILNSLQGVHRRVDHQIKIGHRSQSSPLPVLEENLEILGKFYHWQVCQEVSLRGGIEQSNITPVISSALFIKASILDDLEICNGNCGKIYSESMEREVIKCDCGGEIVLAPPVTRVENVSFVYPENLTDIALSKEEVSPKRILDFAKNSFLPVRITLLLNQISELGIGKKVSFPSFAQYKIKDTNDEVRIYFEYSFKSKDEIIIFACITDTRYRSSDLISAVSLPIILRDMKTSISTDFIPEEVISRTELRGWKITPFIKVKELENLDSLERIFSIFGGMQ